MQSYHPLAFQNGDPQIDNLWSEARASHWHEKQGWLVGCNYIPSTAVNQLEMW